MTTSRSRREFWPLADAPRPRLPVGGSYPGGKVEPEESPTDALHRELLEELHISVTLGAELLNPAGSCWPISADLEMRVWFAVITAGKAMLSSSHDGLAWRKAGDLAELDWLDADRPIVTELSRHLGG